MTDVFGQRQFSLFGTSENRMLHAEPPNLLPDPNNVRIKLHKLLETAKNAKTMPWDTKKAGVWQIVFPQMANWLPEEERDQLRLEFAQEMERLKQA
jgi:hypothetical protein